MRACITLLALVAGAVCAPGFAARPASIIGRVMITRVLAKKRVGLPVDVYGLRGVSTGPPNSAGAVQHSELSRVVIYLQGNGLKAAAPITATLTQQDKHFVPEIVVVPAGSTVSFPNRDPIFHNVFSLSRAKSFDLGYYPAGETRSVRFARPGVVEVYCHIHPDMSAAILVVPSAWWTRPLPDGSFSFAGVPPGAYTLIAWHRSAGFFRRSITVSAEGTQSVVFTIPVRDQGAPKPAQSRGVS
ncbi:MAG: hypothetical protein ACRD3D_07580 [Terriglobia bacterium]